MSELKEYLLLCMILPWYSIYHLVMERKGKEAVFAILKIMHTSWNLIRASLFPKYSV